MNPKVDVDPRGGYGGQWCKVKAATNFPFKATQERDHNMSWKRWVRWERGILLQAG
jgi:hypothetical protein